MIISWRNLITKMDCNSALLIFTCYVVATNAFLDDGGFDPNAINGFPAGPFNPNAGISTIPTPAISGGDSGGSGGSGFNPNAGIASTIAPPTYNGFTGWAGSGSGSGFNPNAGYTTSNPYGGGFGGWGFGGNSNRAAGKSGSTTKSPFGNFGNNYWGFGTGAGGFNPNAPFTTFIPPTIHPTTITIHPTTPTPAPWMPTTTIPKGHSMTTAPPAHNLPITSKTGQGASGQRPISTKVWQTPTTTVGTLAPTSDAQKLFTNLIVG